MSLLRRIKRSGVCFERKIEDSWQYMKVRFRLYNENRIIASKIINNTLLSKEEEKQVYDLFKPYFKPSLDSHRFYKEKTGSFHVDYVPDNIWYAYIDPFYNSWKLDKYLDNKCYYHRIFPQAKMPTLYYYRLNGFWFDANDQIVNIDSVKEFLSGTNCECFLKMAESISGCGYGVTYYNSSIHDFATIEHLLSIHDDMVIQGAIKQHELISSINSSSVNTIRSMSLLKKDGKVKVYSSVLRIGRHGKKVDNASSGGITCGITTEGKLRKYAYSKSGERFTSHPDNHFVFEGAQLPGYDKAIDLVTKIAPTIPHFRLVSWDIAIDPMGEPILIEMNPAYGELDFHQLNNGPVFKEDTIDVLEEVFHSCKK